MHRRARRVPRTRPPRPACRGAVRQDRGAGLLLAQPCQYGGHFRIAVERPVCFQQLVAAGSVELWHRCERDSRALPRSAARNRCRIPSARVPRNIQAAWCATSPRGAGRRARARLHACARPHGRRTGSRRRRRRMVWDAIGSVPVAGARLRQTRVRVNSAAVHAHAHILLTRPAKSGFASARLAANEENEMPSIPPPNRRPGPMLTATGTKATCRFSDRVRMRCGSAPRVFDGARWFEGVAPDLDRHAARVNASAVALGLKPTMSVEEIVGLTWDGLKKFDGKTAVYIRPMYWAEHGGYMSVPADPESTRFCLCLHEAPMLPPSGFSVTVSPFRRPTIETMPTNAKAGLPLSQQRTGDPGGEEPRLRQLPGARHARQRRRDGLVEHLHRQGCAGVHAGAERHLPVRHHPLAHDRPAARSMVSGRSRRR